MYLGFMKKGLSIMTAGVGIIIAAYILSSFFHGVSLFLMMLVVLWFYSFFDAMNLNSLDPESFANVRDKSFCSDLFGENGINIHKPTLGGKGRSAIGLGIVIVGVYMLFESLFSYADRLLGELPQWVYRLVHGTLDFLPRLLLSGLIIYIGYKLVKGKNVKMSRAEYEREEETGNGE